MILQIALYTTIVLLTMLIVAMGILYKKAKTDNEHLAKKLHEIASEQNLNILKKIHISKRQLETTLDAIDDNICMIDSNFNIMRANVSYANSVNCKVHDIAQKKCYEMFWHKKDVCSNCPAVESFKNKKIIKKRIFIKHVNNEERHFELSTYPVLDDSGEIISVIENIRDITIERIQNEQFIKSEKLASIGIMTAGIAHEILNPISGISGTATNMLQKPEKYNLNERGKERIDIILESATRATKIMNDLLKFSQKQNTTRIATDLSMLIPKAVKNVKINGIASIKKEIKIVGNLPKVRCDPTRIEQVINQIVTNSVQSLLDKKKLENDDFEPNISINAYKEQDYVIIDIKDNGLGILPSIESKIFDPFFTTRSPKKGTGLGLSICHRIIEEHQGTISLSTKDGITTASISLPIGSDPWGNF